MEWCDCVSLFVYIFPGDSESLFFCKLIATSHFCKQCLFVRNLRFFLITIHQTIQLAWSVFCQQCQHFQNI